MKAVELQFAIHKNDEVGLKQQQMIHKPTDDQSTLSNEAAKQIVQESHKSAKSEQSAQASLKNEGEGFQKHGSASSKKRKTKQGLDEQGPTSRIEHPYKGHHIDLSL